MCNTYIIEPSIKILDLFWLSEVLNNSIYHYVCRLKSCKYVLHATGRDLAFDVINSLLSAVKVYCKGSKLEPRFLVRKIMISRT